MRNYQSAIIVVLIVVTLLNVVFILVRQQNDIAELRMQNQVIAKQEKIYETSLELMFNRNSISFSDTLSCQFVLYFPSKACSACLEGLLLLIEDDEELKNRVMVYFDAADKIPIVNSFNDMYSTNYSYLLGKALYCTEQSKISLLKIRNGNASGVLLLDGKNKQDFKMLLQMFKELQ